MKIYLFSIAIFLVSPLSYAKVVEVEVPDKAVSYSEINVNFDDSVTILRPRVWASGAFVPMLDYQLAAKVTTATMACQLFGFSEFRSKSSARDKYESEKANGGKLFAALGRFNNGDVYLYDLINANDSDHRVIETITCRPE